MKRLAIVAAAVLFTNAALAQPQYDLLLTGGHVIDPRSDINRRMDVAITAGKIARVADTIPAGDARRVVDVSGLFVTRLLRGNQCEPVRGGFLNRRPPVSERKVLPLRPGLPEIAIERAARLS